jgi:hypothetical protein
MADFDAFAERAAILEFSAGMTRFQAETTAAQAQGMTRWQALKGLQAYEQEISARNSQRGGDLGKAAFGNGSDNLPGVQSASQEQERPVSVGDVQAGRDRVALLALPERRGAVL